MELPFNNLISLWIIFLIIKSYTGFLVQKSLSSGHHPNEFSAPRTSTTGSRLWTLNEIRPHYNVFRPFSDSQTQQSHDRTEEHRLGKISSIELILKNDLQKTIHKRDTASLKDLRKDLNKLLLHQLQKQMLTTVRPSITNTLNNIPNIMHHFLNSKLKPAKDQTGLMKRIASFETRNTQTNNFDNDPQAAGLLKKNSNLNTMAIHDSTSNNHTSPLHDDQGHGTNGRHHMKMVHHHDLGRIENSNASDTKTKLVLNHVPVVNNSVYHAVSYGTTKQPSVDNFHTTLTRHYDIVHPTRSAETETSLPTDIPDMTPMAMPLNGLLSESVTTYNSNTHLEHDGKTHELNIPFHNTRTNMITADFTKEPITKMLYDSTIEHINTLTTAAPYFPSGGATDNQTQDTNPNPTPAFTTYTQAAHSTVTKIQTSSNQNGNLPETLMFNTVVPGSPLVAPSQYTISTDQFQENRNSDAPTTTPKVHPSKLINLKGVHILFTNDKPNYNAISKNPTLHLTASVKTTLNDRNDTSRKTDHTAGVKTSASDLQFSTSSENKYVGTALIRNGHLFLVVYPPEKILRPSENDKTSGNNTDGSPIHASSPSMKDSATMPLDAKPTAIPSDSTLASPSSQNLKLLSTVKNKNHLQTLLVPALTNSILSSLRPYTTLESSRDQAYHQSTASVKISQDKDPHHSSSGEGSYQRLERVVTEAIGKHSNQASPILHRHNMSPSNLHSNHVISNEVVNENKRHKSDDLANEHVSDGVSIQENKTEIATDGLSNNIRGHLHKDYSMEKIVSYTEHSSESKSHAENSTRNKSKLNQILHKAPAKATDPFERIHGVHVDHSIHGVHANKGSGKVMGSNKHGSKNTERFSSPWKNVDLSLVLPKFSNVKSHKVSTPDDDSKSKINVFSFVAKATDPFDKIQSILNNLQPSEDFKNRTSDHSTKSGDDTTFNFELTVHSDGSADTSKNADDDSTNSNSKKDTTDELLELLSSTIHHAAKAYDMEIHRDRILQKMLEVAKLNHSNMSDELKDLLPYIPPNEINETITLNEKYSTSPSIKLQAADEMRTVSVQPDVSHTTEKVNESLLNNNMIYTTNHELPLSTAVELNPTSMPTERHTENKNSKSVAKNNALTHKKVQNQLENNTRNGTNQNQTLHPDIMQIIAQRNMTEDNRRRYIRNKIVQDIINTKSVYSTTQRSVMHNELDHENKRRTNVLQSLLENNHMVNTGDRSFHDNDLFLKNQSNRKEIHHEMPLSKALYLIKQQTNELRSQNTFETLSGSNTREDFNSEFNAMLILSIDDILSDHTNLHGALVVSFLSQNTNNGGNT